VTCLAGPVSDFKVGYSNAYKHAHCMVNIFNLYKKRYSWPAFLRWHLIFPGDTAGIIDAINLSS
jgi:hypothetical protein